MVRPRPSYCTTSSYPAVLRSSDVTPLPRRRAVHPTARACWRQPRRLRPHRPASPAHGVRHPRRGCAGRRTGLASPRSPWRSSSPVLRPTRCPSGWPCPATVEGAVFGLFPIMWIVFTAIVLYQVTVASGRFEDLRATFHLISDDPRIQAIIIAFCFGGLLEALAGFGAPVAITGVMLMALRLLASARRRRRAPGQHRPGRLRRHRHPDHHRGLADQDPLHPDRCLRRPPDPDHRGLRAAVAARPHGRRQCAGSGRRWPVAVVVGLAFAVAQWISATYISVELTDIIASLAGLAAAVVFLRFWQPAGPRRGARRPRARAPSAILEAGLPVEPGTGTRTPRSAAATTATATCRQSSWPVRPARLTDRRIGMALFPYLLVIADLLDRQAGPRRQDLAGEHGHQDQLAGPGRGQVLTAAGKPKNSSTSTPSRGCRTPARACSSAPSSSPSSTACRWASGGVR
jgi:lactate permease